MGSLNVTLIRSLNVNFDGKFNGNLDWMFNRKTYKNFDWKGKDREKEYKKKVITFLFTRAMLGTSASR